jgi:hypothetical protein
METIVAKFTLGAQFIIYIMASDVHTYLTLLIVILEAYGVLTDPNPGDIKFNTYVNNHR